MLIVHAIAKWIDDSGQGGHKTAGFPGLLGCGSPTGTLDREWILEIARQYYHLIANGQRSMPVANMSKFAGRRTNARFG